MDQFIFDYNKFYIYYSNPKNVEYKTPGYTKKLPEKSKELYQFVIINNTELFIDINQNNNTYFRPNSSYRYDLLFSKDIQSTYDYHYHFGITRGNTTKDKGKNVIFFHITDYNYEPKHRVNCYFYDGQIISSKMEIFKNMKCENDENYMNKFSEEDLQNIYEIICRPFITNRKITKGGSKKKKIRKSIKTRKISGSRKSKKKLLFL